MRWSCRNDYQYPVSEPHLFNGPVGLAGLRRFASQHGLRVGQLHYWVHGDRKSSVLAERAPVFRDVRLAGIRARLRYFNGGGSGRLPAFVFDVAFVDGLLLFVKEHKDA